MATPLPRRVVGIVSSLLVAATAVVGLAAPAQAEEGYQYWNYFHLENDAWAFSDVGPAQYQPEDGAVEGFRYGTSTVSQGIEPRADLAEVNFDSVCADTDAAEGEKRVAVVLDYGTEEKDQGAPPEPRAECAVVAQDASAQQVLEAVSDVRVESGMTCALDGYPASGCGVPVKDADVPKVAVAQSMRLLILVCLSPFALLAGHVATPVPEAPPMMEFCGAPATSA